MKGFLGVGLIGSLILTSFNSVAQTNFWRVRQSPVVDNLHGVTHGRGQFVAVGNHRLILSSGDATTWRVRSHAPASSDNLNAVAFGNGTFAAVGTSGLVLTSTNGANWKTRRSEGQTLLSVVHANNRFVAVGEGPILLSTNMTNWGRVTNFSSTLRSVDFGNGTFVAVGDDGIVATSAAGRKWKLQNVAFPTNTTLEAIIFNGSAFVASARERFGGVELVHNYTTVDGVTWAETAPPSFYINAFALGDQGVLGVGDFGDGTGRTQLSTDGLSWPGDPISVSRMLLGATFAEGRYVAVGRRGLILQSKL